MSSQEDVGVLNIDKVIITGLTIPVIHPDPDVTGGLALSLIVNSVVKVLIDPWLNQSADDRAELLINEEPTAVATKTINPGEENKRFTMDLPAAFLRNGINRIRLRVTRVSQEPETSADLVVLYHTPRPGGEVVGSGDNPNLLMTLPADVIDKGVDAARAAQGVDVTLSYVHMREHDKITLDCDGHLVLHTVTAAQAAADTVVLKLFADDFWQDNQEFALKFRVVDQIGNSSGPLAIWSSTTVIDVHIRKPVLDLLPPKVLEAKDSNGTVLNFVRDFYEAQFATVEVNYIGSAPGQTVKVYWLGRNSTYGSEIQTVAVAGETLRFLVPRLEVVDCIGKEARIWYTVRLPNTTQDRPSRELNITVTPQSLSLGEPTLNADKTNLRTPYPSLVGQYSVRMAFFGVNTYYGPEVPITQASYTNHSVPRAWLDENRGKTVMFNFTLRKTGAGEPIIFSWCLRLIP
ncbi:hypothetical protein F6R97_30315 [Pseudomonas sp. JV414]|uniref:hypothetical protein n=1 Tax=Pseudomonas sp. JV414 TaxID=1733110 RepID=UPI0028E0C595|nr:hypothetical protein [Pseudomonas sp. JV414]MDT9678783.1 hypothetical protein [Pseudomonas sp. JV414]